MLTPSLPSLPIQITDVRYDKVPGGCKNLTYSIRNDGDIRVAAIEMFVEVSDGSAVSRSPQYIDSWPHGQGVPGNSTFAGPQGLSMQSKEGSVSSIVLTVGAVVFDDGTMAGPDAAEFRKFLSQEHSLMQAQAARVKAVLDSQGFPAAAEMIANLGSSSAEQRRTNVLLQEALQKDGAAGLRTQIAEILNPRP